MKTLLADDAKLLLADPVALREFMDFMALGVSSGEQSRAPTIDVRVRAPGKVFELTLEVGTKPL